MSEGVSAVERGCGTRVKGGVYSECGVSKDGKYDASDFVVCEPLVVDADKMGLAAIGTKLIRRKDGTWDIFDIIGVKHYRNPTDFLEEATRFGFSRRLSSALDFSLLTPGSRHVLLHAHGHLDNAGDFFAARDEEHGWDCPRRLEHHRDPAQPPAMCASLWWSCIEGGTPNGISARSVTRTLPSFSYSGSTEHFAVGADGARRRVPGGVKPPRFLAEAPPKGLRPQYRMAVIAAYPITNLAVIRDVEGGSHVDTADKVAKSKIRMSLEDH